MTSGDGRHLFQVPPMPHDITSSIDRDFLDLGAAGLQTEGGGGGAPEGVVTMHPLGDGLEQTSNRDPRVDATR